VTPVKPAPRRLAIETATLRSLTDIERLSLLKDICVLVGLDPERATAEALKERVALIDEYADRYEGVLR
jgi:hypothetical protein